MTVENPPLCISQSQSPHNPPQPYVIRSTLPVSTTSFFFSPTILLLFLQPQKDWVLFFFYF